MKSVVWAFMVLFTAFFAGIGYTCGVHFASVFF